MGHVKRKGTTKTSILGNKVFHEKNKFLLQISGMVTKHKLPDELVLNWDQTSLQLVPAGNWTLEEQGTIRVEITRLNDKRMITATFAITLSGKFCQCKSSIQRKRKDAIHAFQNSHQNLIFGTPLTTGLITKHP